MQVVELRAPAVEEREKKEEKKEKNEEEKEVKAAKTTEVLDSLALRVQKCKS
jgi:hypothetical protein